MGREREGLLDLNANISRKRKGERVAFLEDLSVNRNKALK